MTVNYKRGICAEQGRNVYTYTVAHDLHGTGAAYLPGAASASAALQAKRAMPVTYRMQILPDAWQAYSSIGSSVAASDGLLAVGAKSQNPGGMGHAAGAVYTFEAADGEWFQRSVLTSAQPQPYDNFPSALAFARSTHIFDERGFSLPIQWITMLGLPNLLT